MDSIKNFIESSNLEDLDDYDLADAIIERGQITSVVKDKKQIQFLNKMYELLKELFTKIKNGFNYWKEHDPVVMTLSNETKALWYRVSPELANVLSSSAKIYKNIAVFVINCKQYAINLMYNTEKGVIVFFSDLFCCVVEGLLKKKPVTEA